MFSKYLNLFFFISLITPVGVIAGEGSGKITRLLAHNKIVNGENVGVIMFKVENSSDPLKSHINPPENCPGLEWAFDANDGNGKAMYSLLLSAAAQGKPVYVKGAGDCQAWGDRERPYYISITY